VVARRFFTLTAPCALNSVRWRDSQPVSFHATSEPGRLARRTALARVSGWDALWACWYWQRRGS